MRLQLEDSGQIKLTTPAEFLPLEGARGKARKARHRENKAIKHETHVLKLKKKRDVKIGRQDKRLIKLKPQEEEQGSFSPSGGGGGSPSGGGGGGGSSSGGGEYQEPEVFSPEQEATDEFEYMPEQEEAGPYENMNDAYGLSGGILSTLFNAAKGAASGIINQGKSQVQQRAQQSPAMIALQKENAALQQKIQSMESSSLLKIGGSALAGSVAGFIVGKILK